MLRFPTRAQKAEVKGYWERKVCGTIYGKARDDASGDVDLDRMAEMRYRLEPYIEAYAEFPSACGESVLEIGVGAGVDFANWIRHGAIATGIDLTQAGVAMTRRRLDHLGIDGRRYRLLVGDAENLPFCDATFKMVYSHGVLHHSPDTGRAIAEAHRVLQPGGVLKAMVYHVPSWIGWMLWTRFSLLRGRPFKSPRRAIYEHLESPGTKAYTVGEASSMLAGAGFREFRVWPQLSFGDLLLNAPSAGYRSPIYRLIWKLYPRWFIRLFGDRWGNALFMRAVK